MKHTSASSPTAAIDRRWCSPLAMLTLVLLAAQFLVGMVVNFYVQIPATHPGSQSATYFRGVLSGIGWAVTDSAVLLRVHAVLGLLLLLASLLLLGLAIAARRRAWIIAALLGWIGITGAGFNGASFVNYGYDVSSLLMSVGFLLATASYGIVLYVTK